MKRFFATIFALIAVFALSVGALPELGTAPFDPAYELTLSCTDKSYFAGNEIYVTVSVSDITPIAGLSFVSFRLYFDSSMLTPIVQNDGGMNDNFAALLTKCPDSKEWECLGKLTGDYYELSAMTSSQKTAKDAGSIEFKIGFTVKDTAKGLMRFVAPHTYCTAYDYNMYYELQGKGADLSVAEGQKAVTLKDGVSAAFDGDYIVVTAQNLTGSQFKNYFTGTVTLNTSSGSAASSSKAICTGYTVLVDKKTYTVVVMGDINGDGKIAMIDYVKLKRAVQNLDKLTGAYEKAAHITGASKIKLVDYIRLKRYVQGLDTLLPN